MYLINYTQKNLSKLSILSLKLSSMVNNKVNPRKHLQYEG